MKKSLFFIIFLSLSYFNFGQTKNVNPNSNGEPWILGGLKLPSQEEINQIPQLVIEEKYKTKDLPASLDNSQKLYFRPIFSQTHGSCGQASGVGYTFTYEMNRARGTSANTTATQYPTHYTYNFLNSGSGDIGSWYSDGWNIIKANGCPNVATYGSLAQEANYWMSGYSNYEAGMENRVAEIYNIDVSNEAGLETMKYWMFNHGEGSNIGGIVNFAAGIEIDEYELTYQAGKYIVIKWGYSANHAMTFAGYDDNISFDFNNDGVITNNIDITGDGNVDMKDWEQGAVLMVNSWGTSWGGSGKAYVPYRLLALPISEGGIGAGNMVSCIKVKETYSPTLIMKVQMQHNQRNKIKIVAGVSTNLSATLPEHTISFPLFNYQGGDYNMQGVNSNPIEFSLDITPLLAYVNSGENVKYFLQVIENDEFGEATGTIQSYSVKKNNGEEFTSSQTNVSVVNNSTTTLSVLADITFETPVIQTTILDNGVVNEYFSNLFTATGGTEPYIWSLLIDYNESVISENFPSVNSNNLNVTDYDDGYATQTLDFTFPFYGENYNTVYLRTDGSIVFEPGFSYLRSEELIIQNKVISVFASDLMIYPADGDGIFYEGNENYATFRWKTSLYDQQDVNVDVAITIYPDGNIKLYYGNSITSDLDWAAGISNGDNINYVITSNSGENNPSNKEFLFERFGCPLGMTFDAAGNFRGTPLETGTWDLNISVRDNNNLRKNELVSFTVAPMKLEETIETKVNVFPNPTSDFLNILYVSDLEENIIIEINDILGKQVYKSSINVLYGLNNISIDVNNLKSGIYIIVIKTQVNTTNQTVIINK